MPIPTGPGIIRGLIALAVLATACAAPTQPERDQHLRDKWLSRAQAGNAKAQYYVARSYCCGSGPTYDIQQALQWYCRAARQGFLPAQVELGDLYSGNYPPDRRPDVTALTTPDFLKAYLWYTAAAAQGDDAAFRRRQELGNMMNPRDVVQAKQSAARWEQQDCDRP